MRIHYAHESPEMQKKGTEVIKRVRLITSVPFFVQARRLAIAAPRSPGDFTVVTPAFSIAANLPSAVPAPPEAMAPAWPMRLPFGAEAPAMKPTTGLVTCSA